MKQSCKKKIFELLSMAAGSAFGVFGAIFSSSSLVSFISNIVIPIFFGIIFVADCSTDSKYYERLKDIEDLSGLFSFFWALISFGFFSLSTTRNFKGTGLESQGVRLFLFFSVMFVIIVIIFCLKKSIRGKVL